MTTPPDVDVRAPERGETVERIPAVMLDPAVIKVVSEVLPAGAEVNYEEAARAATAVVKDPSVVAAIRAAAGIADPDVIDPNPDWLTLDEVDKVEEMLGMPIDAMAKMARRGPALRVIATVVKQRTDPMFVLAQAGSLRIKFGGDSKPDVVPPTSGNGSEPPLPSPTTTA